VRADGAVAFDEDRDDPTSPMDRLEAFFLRPASYTLRQVDDSLPPMMARGEVQMAKANGAFVGCDFDYLLYCQAIGTTTGGNGGVVHLQQSSYRAVGAIYQLRYQLVRLGLLVWPIAIVLAWITGSRIVRPIEKLRAQARARSSKLQHASRDE